MARVSIDHVPTISRPSEMHAIDDVRQLRDRAREASEQVAAAQQAVDAAEREVVASAAAAARAGQPVGAEGKSVEKARAALLAAQRASNVVRLAQQGAEDDVAKTISEQSDVWLEQLDRTAVQARERAVEALAVFEAAALEISRTAGAQAWLRSAGTDGRYDRVAPQMVVGTTAPSSRSVTANSEPLHVDALIGWLREALLEPQAPARSPIGITASA